MARKEHVEAAIDRLLTIHFRSPEDTLRFVLASISQIGQSCDVTFRDRPPLLDVKVDKLLKGFQLFGQWSKVRFSDGSQANLKDIWTVQPTPMDGIPPGALEDVDPSDGDRPIDDNGVTYRDMVRALYRPATKAQEDEM